MNTMPLSLGSRGKAFDGFCWQCNLSINSGYDYNCRQCYRSFHYSCNSPERINRSLLTKQLQDYVLAPGNKTCVVCEHLHICELNYAEAEIPEVNNTIVIAIDKLLTMP